MYIYDLYIYDLFAHQWGSVFVPYAGSGSSGVHVAEQTLCLPEGNAASSVTHLETDRIHSSCLNMVCTVPVMSVNELSISEDYDSLVIIKVYDIYVT